MFLKDSFQFTKGLLCEETSGHLHCQKENVEQNLKETHSNENAQRLCW